jgi:type VI secretion system protein ImpA
MGGLDTDQLLRAVTAAEPCGDHLDGDPAFTALERASKGTPERVMGTATNPAVPPDWSDVCTRAIALFDRTKDLRVAILLTQALLHAQGLPGFRDGLYVIHRLITDFWDSVHPILDPDDGLDPALRVNTLATLTGDTILRDVREIPLVMSRAFGPVTLRDHFVSTGQLAAIGDTGTQLNAASIKAAFMDVELEPLRATALAAHQSLSLVGDIEEALTTSVGVNKAADFSALAVLLKSMTLFLDERLADRETDESSMSTPDPSETVAPLPPAAVGLVSAKTPVTGPVSGEVRGPDDVVRLLDAICTYYKRQEPSSPVPLLLVRARRLVSKNFVDIIRDLTPDAMNQVDMWRGGDGAEASE